MKKIDVIKVVNDALTAHSKFYGIYVSYQVGEYIVEALEKAGLKLEDDGDNNTTNNKDSDNYCGAV